MSAFVCDTYACFSVYCYLSGCGDYQVADVSHLPDPCPLPDATKRRSLNEMERKIYAPLSGVGGVVYDKDAVYIDMGDTQPKQKQHDEQVGKA